jgi:copper transport protein
LRSGGTAEIAAVELILFALAAVAARLRRPGWTALMLAGVIIAEGIRSHPEGIVPVGGAALAYCHVTPALLWAGLLAYSVRTARQWRHHPVAAQGIIRLYATAAAWLFFLVLATGVISAVVLVPVGSLLTTAYGLFLIAKAAVVCVAAGLALAGRRWLRRRSVAGTGPALAIRLELVALAMVLAITGVLTVLTPAAKPISAASERGIPAAQRVAAARPHPIGEPVGPNRR